MEAVRLFWLGALVAVLSACGGGGSGSVDSAPVISNLRYTPSTELQLPGSRTTVDGTIDFADTGRNVIEMHLTTSAGDSLTVPLSVPDTASGTLTGSFTVALDQIGRSTFEIWLQDSAGQMSNRLGGTFDVLVNDTVPRWRHAPGQTELYRLLETRPLNAVAWNGTQYVFVGGGVIVMSSDLVSWTLNPTPSSDQALNSIAWSGTALVAVGSEPRYGGARDVLLHSTNGVDWTATHMADQCPAPLPGTTPPPCTYKAGLSKVIWAGSQFVAVGREAVPGVGTFALILTSPDGVTWTQQSKNTLPVGADIDGMGMGMTSVAWSGNLVVSVGRTSDGSAALWTSTDARNWSAGTLPALPQFTLRDIAWGLGRFVAVGWGGTLPPIAVRSSATVSSSDGIGWQINASSLPLSALNAVGVGPTRSLIVSTTDYATSLDGRQWSATVNASTCAGGVIWDGRRWVGVNGTEVCISP
jgi:hypothetical protein